uniref:Trichohyalin-like n=1 Tax=Sinocyclocheilus grahami TaxID=75366 RepID=A0A672RL65_SINGR
MKKVSEYICGVSPAQGEIFAAGGNSDGQLGLGHCNDSVSFRRLHPFCDYAPIKLLSAGGHTSAALTEDGRLFLWGDNSVGQLGLVKDSHALLPKELKLGQSIQWVSCGYRHSALVTDNGDVFTFGESADGRLGLSAHQLANHSQPQRVESLHGVLQVACGGKHTLALTEDELYSFGRGEFGQLGLGTLMFLADTPVAVGHFRKGRVTHVTCGENHSALITDSGLLYTFGDGRHGKLGLGDENFTNQFSPTVCQRFLDYSVMTVACGSSHMLVFARPRQQESEEVCLEDEDVTYSYLDRCYTSMLQGQPLEHIPDSAHALVSQPTFLPSSLPTSHRWSLSTRARRRQKESSSAQFGPEFCNLPPPTTGFTALALTGNILQPRSPTDTPKRFRTEAFVESASTSITLPARTTPLTQITKNEEDCHSVGTSENSISDKTHEENKHSGMVENIPQKAPPTKVQASSVSHSSVTESPPSRNLKNKKPRSGDPKNPAMAEEHSSVTASQSKMQSKTYKKTIQSTNNKSKSQAVEVRLSSDRMSDKEKEGSSETCSTNIDQRDNISKADKYSKVQHADSRGQEVTALAEMKRKTKSSPIEIQKTFSRSSPVQEVEQVRTTPTKVQEVKSPKIKEMGIPVGTTKRVQSPVKVQNMPSGAIEVSKVESTPQADAQRGIKPSLGNAQEVRSTLINTQEQGNSTSVKIPAKMQSTPKKGKEKNDVDTEESPSEFTPKKAKKKRSDVERAPIAPTPSPLSVSIPTRISKAKKGKPVESKNSNFQLKHAMPAQEKIEIKRENDSKIPQNSDISFPPIKKQKSGGTAEKSQSASNLHSPTDKVFTEQKHEFPSIKSLAPERGHSFSSLWSKNQSATNKSSATKKTKSSSGKLLSPSSSSPQHKQSPLKENKFARKTVEPKEPDRKPQAEQSIMGSVVSSLPAMAIASAAPLLIKAAKVLSETQPEPSIEMSSHASMSKEASGSNILLEQEVDQDSTVQVVSAIKERDDSIIRQQSAQDEQNMLVSNENEMWVSGDGKIEEEEHVKYSETERKEEGGEKERLAEEEDELQEVGQEEENSAVEDEEERESKSYEGRGESAQQGEEENEEEETSRKEEDDSNSGQSSKSEGEMSKGEESGDETEREEGEQSEGQEKEESEEGETDEKEEEDEESAGDDKEEERESWDEGSEREVEDEEKTDAEEEQEGESSNEEKTDEQSESDNDKKNERSDEEKGESEEKDESEEENEKVEGEGEQEEKGEEESEEEDEVGNEDEEENQEEESDHEEEEESRDQAKEEEEEEENNEEEEGVDEEENNEELKDKKDGVTNQSEEEESVREREERQNEVEAEDEEKMSETDGDGDREKQEGKEQIEEEDGEKEEDKKEGEMDTAEEKFREEENLDILETQETERGDEDDETDKLNEMEEENGHEEEAEDEEIDQKEENKTTERSQRKQRETNEEEEEGGEEVKEEEEEEEETEQKNKNIKPKKNRRKQRETSEEEEEEEEESEEEEEETEQEVKNIKTEKNRRKPRETSEEEEEEESEEEEEETEQEEKNIKTDKNRRKPRESSEEEEESEEESEEEEEETEQEVKNIKTEKNRRKPRETSEEEEEEESEEEEEETEQEENNIKTEKNRRKQRESSEEEEEQEEESEEEEEEEEEIEQKENNIKIETSEEEEEQSEGDEEEEEEKETEHKEKNNKKDKHGSDEEEEGEEEEEEETERKEENIKTEKNERKQRETSEEEEEQEEETDEEEEEGEEQEGEEEEEEKNKKVPKQRAKPDALPPRRQTNAQRDRQKTRQRHQQNVKGQTDSGAQDPQFWNNVLPQYLNLK